MKRGQSALEYLVTYGWAILAIVIVAALLWALGIFNPGGLVGTGNKASGFSFNILDQKYADTVLTINLGNTQGKSVNIISIKVAGAGTMTASNMSVGNATVFTVTAAPSCGATGATFTNVPVIITYDINGGIGGHTDSGTISGVCA